MRQVAKRLKEKEESTPKSPPATASSPTPHPSLPAGVSAFDSLRRASLASIFALFDLDGGGSIEVGELLLLGKARRESGQKETAWNDGKNLHMFGMVDEDGSGTVDIEEFIHYFPKKQQNDNSKQFEECVR